MQARRGLNFRGRLGSRAPMVACNGPLAKVPPLVAFLGVLIVFGVAVWLRGVAGAVLLGLLGLGVLGLLAVTWQALKPGDRVLRVVVVIILAGVAISLLR
ncbi:MAG TPA: hypothetical protein VFW65_23710 [Pseudonocardiaceae bacterium]|nr:hypothetical protein [Pseudonocardiaceae bacterium]